MTNHPKMEWLKTIINILIFHSLFVSGTCEWFVEQPGMDFSGVSVKLRPRKQSSEALNEAERSSIVVHSHVWQSGACSWFEVSVLSPWGLAMGLLECHHDMVARFPLSKPPENQGGICNTFHGLASGTKKK